MKPLWTFHRFDDCPIHDWYAASVARVDVFVMEQQCPFQDFDGADQRSWHLFGWDGEGAQKKLAAYCRLVDAGVKFKVPSIGRVITTMPYRRAGYGKQLMTEALRRHHSVYPGQPNRIGAQARLERFYESFGYKRDSENYIEDGIPHVEMIREASE
jgi:ElaA protein